MDDFQTMLNNKLEVKRSNELKYSHQLLLGEMILKLKMVKNKKLPLFIDIMDKRPMGVISYRGFYAELAITTEDFGSYESGEKFIPIGKKNPTVKEWIKVLESTIGKTFMGYKGGDYVMSKNTPVWLAEYRECCFMLNEKPLDEEHSNYKEVFFIDVREDKDRVYLLTRIAYND